MADGLVSVIMPAYNVGRFIGEALESAFAQDYRPLEVIVIDDGSTDDTAEVATRYDVELVRQANRGPGAARNAGLAIARGEYIANLDADDIWPEDRLSALVDAFDDSPDASLALGLSEFFVTPGEPVPAHYPHKVPNPARGHMTALMAKRSVFDQIGGYDERLLLCEDIDWFMRARDAGAELVEIDRVVLRYRIHAQNISRNKFANQVLLPGILRASLKRRRGTVS